MSISHSMLSYRVILCARINFIIIRHTKYHMINNTLRDVHTLMRYEIFCLCFHFKNHNHHHLPRYHHPMNHPRYCLPH